MKNKFNNFFKDINVSKELDKKIYNNTIYQKEESKRYILKPVIVILILFIFLGVGVMAKDYIKEFVFNIKKSDNNIQTTYSLNGFVEVNNDFECSDDLTLMLVHEKLGIEVLDFGEFNNLKIDYCEILRDDNNNIRKVILKTPRIFSKEQYMLPKNLFVSLEFLTKYATKEDIKEMQNVKWVSITTLNESKDLEKYIENYHIKSLDTNSSLMYLTKYRGINIFNYNNVIYQMETRHIFKEDFINFLENLK